MSNDDTIERALELGVVYFKNEDFRNAQNLFTKALKLALSYEKPDLEKIRLSQGLTKRPVEGMGELVHPRLVKLLDNRAATWEKMGDLQKALKDADRCVRFEPFNLRCYLRRGKILQKQEKEDDALENYEKGIMMMKEMSRKWHLSPSTKLMGMVEYQKELIYNRTNKQKALTNKKIQSKRILILPPQENRLSQVKGARSGSTTKLDILGQCPIEILRRILLNLDTKQLIKCLLVCKVWKARIYLLPEVFSRFDLSNCNNRAIVSFQNFVNKIYKEQGGARIDIIKIHSSALSGDERSSVTFLRNLRPRVKTIVLHSRIVDFKHLTCSLAGNKRLSANLEELSLSCNYRITTVPSLESLLLGSLENIRKLDLIFANSAGVSKDFVSTEDFTSEQLCRNLQHLKSFKLICDLRHLSSSFPFKSFLTLGHLNRLEKLYICGATFDSTMGFDWLCNFSNLRELWFENNKNAFLEDFLRVMIHRPLFNSLSKITFREHRISSQPVNLRQYPQLMENSHLLQNLTALETLDLMSTSIGARGMLVILSALSSGRLKKLNIGDCPYIHFQRGNNNGYMSMKELLLRVPHVEELLLHQSVALDDYSINELARNVKHVKKLRYLDLSFNMSLTGVSIYELLRALKEEFIILNKLLLDGCPSINEGTISSLRRTGLVKELSCSYEKVSWKVYGVNTLANSHS
ncbi:LANO_0H24344g1_1 [Lachancea nothofagi CBS 11611]|uniref:LANO_0H24344g1_1 n=1 Tax=Lachancea nothofagi CBS 11611 TaxID=1266666 RepID=A0A1G4KP10_9SACH|nr:LANO_0H24344g1_1 [Lachancea nothofagi CBS 11611]